MVTMVTLPPAKELKIQVVIWQNEIRTLDVLKSPTCDKNQQTTKIMKQLPSVQHSLEDTEQSAIIDRKKYF